MGFFDKLKIGAQEETAPKTEPPKKKAGRPKGGKVKIKPAKETIKKAATESGEPLAKGEARSAEERRLAVAGRDEPSFEGELAIDVYETDRNFIVQSTIAGVKAEDLDITIENDIVTIKGSREKQVSEETKKYYYQECYWGAFSRQVILPEEVDGSKAEASIKDGVLTLSIPKIVKIQKRKISIRQES